LISHSTAAHADGANTYKTSKGAIFTQVQGPGSFGKAWKDPSGTVWSAYQGDFANNALKPDQNNLVVDSPATAACAKIGGALPMAQQYKNLDSYFELDPSYGYLTDQGRADLYAIFPDMLDRGGGARGFWTSSVVPHAPDIAYLFGADTGVVGDIDGNRSNPFLSVRCVGR
jgi:hypothetical protein